MSAALPYAFTEQGFAMLSSVLRSPRAVEVHIAIMRTFVQLRRLMDTNALLDEVIFISASQHFRISALTSRTRLPYHPIRNFRQTHPPQNRERHGQMTAPSLLTNFPVFGRFSGADRRSLMAVFKTEIRSSNHAGGPHDHGGTEETEVTEFFWNQRPPAKQAEQRSSVSSVSSVPQWFTKHACCRMSVFGFSGKMGA